MKKVIVIDGEDAAPEAMIPALDVVEHLTNKLDLDIQFSKPLVGQPAIDQFGEAFPASTKKAIDDSDATWFGATSSLCIQAIIYLRWGKQTYANVRPCSYFAGAVTPLKNPEYVDFVIIRENLEDLYLGLEGDLQDLSVLRKKSIVTGDLIEDSAPGRYALKAITEKGSERVIRYAYQYAMRADRKKRLTIVTKRNMLSYTDGLFYDVAMENARDYPEVEVNHMLVDNFCAQMIAKPEQFDVVVTPNLYGDILSDGAAGMVGGLGLAASACYGEEYAYFESVHGTAPDIAGKNLINPTASLMSARLMLDYLGYEYAGKQLEKAIREVYKNGKSLTVDQGGVSKSTDFCNAVKLMI